MNDSLLPAGGERCVRELRDIVGSDHSTVSKHLSLMRAAGLVVDRKEGLQVFYSLRVPLRARLPGNDAMSCPPAGRS